MTSKLPYLIIITIAIIVEMASTDILLPVLPQLQLYYHTTPHFLELIVSVNLLGLAISGAFYGPLSDQLGRRKIYIIGNFLFLVGTIACALVINIKALIVARLIQGLGGGVCAPVGLAIFKDIYQERDYVKVLSLVGILLTASPVIFPLIGAYVADYFGWKMIFYSIIFLSGIANFFIIFVLKESNNSIKNATWKFSTIIKNYITVVKNARFLGFSLICASTYAAIWAYVAVFVLVYVNTFGLKVETYGWFLMINVLVSTIASLLQTKLVNTIEPKKLLLFGLIVLMFSAICLISTYLLDINNILVIAVETSIYWIGTAFVFPNANEMALSEFDALKGSASSFLISLELIMGSLAVYITSLIYDGTIKGIAITTIVCVTIALLCYMYTKTEVTLNPILEQA